ncbi:MAG TPA: radical SAM protein [Acidimicrobiia bacterium]|nr:radical SAM protein [Acidimicrobiia bacterium]
MKILLVSSYELGHQPFHVASAASALGGAGHDIRTCDLSLGPLKPLDVEWAEAVAFAVPMHTAMKVALQASRQLNASRPELPLCFYGLYAAAADLPAGASAVAGEYEPGLLRWAAGVRRGSHVDLERSAITVAPDRTGLAGLTEYVGVELGGERRVAGSTTASRGCRYRCRHCPVPTVYDGAFRVVDRRLIAQDIDAQVAAGARHISFADPDFLNGPSHALRVLEETRSRHPDLTFDATIKVEHILRHRDLLPRMAELGLVFVVSAFESTNDETLQRLDKGHTVADMAESVHLLRAAAIDIRPTWLPFTPWTTMQDLVAMLQFMELHGVDVDPIQLTIRLLIPRGSLLLNLPPDQLEVGEFDPGALTFAWEASDRRLDELHGRLVDLMERMEGRPRDEVLEAMTRAILNAAGMNEDAVRLASGEGRPRLTEPWFC